jgi:hypothetical protein
MARRSIEAHRDECAGFDPLMQQVVYAERGAAKAVSLM